MMKMLRWMCSVIRMDKINNEYIRESKGNINIAKNMRENKLKRFGQAVTDSHIEVRNKDDIVEKICEIRVEENRKKSRLKKY